MAYDYHRERGCALYFEGLKSRNVPPPPNFTPLIRANLDSDAFSGAISSAPPSRAEGAAAAESLSETGGALPEDGDTQWRVSHLDKAALSAAADDSPPVTDEGTRATPAPTRPPDMDEVVTDPLPTAPTTRADDAAAATVNAPPVPSEASATSAPPRPPLLKEEEQEPVTKQEPMTSGVPSDPQADQPDPMPTATNQLANANGDSPLDARNSRRRQQMLEKQQRHESIPNSSSPPSPTGSEAAEEDDISSSIAATPGVESIPATYVPRELKTEGGVNSEEIPATATNPDPTAPVSLACDSFSSEDAEGTNVGGAETAKRGEAGGAGVAGGVDGEQKGKGKKGRRRKKKGKGNTNAA